MSAPQLPTAVALVGCGAVADLYYTPAFRELEQIGVLRVKALVDTDPVKAERLGTHFPAASIHRSLTGLAEDAVDLAVVASPPRFHAAQAIQLLRSGVAVLCEKPMAGTVAEAEAMVEAADVAQRLLAVGLVRRFLPACQTIRAILLRGVLGNVESFRFVEGGQFRWPTQSPGYFRRGEAVGGVLADIGSHLLDLVTWWMGEPVHVRYADDAMGGIEMNCVMELEFPGFAGVVRLSRERELRGGCFIRGAKGWLRWSVSEPETLEIQFDGMPAAVVGRLYENDAASAFSPPLRRVRNFEQSFVSQLINVVAAVQGKGAAFVTGRDALPGIRLVERCYRHRRLMPMGWLSEGERARAEDLSRGTAP